MNPFSIVKDFAGEITDKIEIFRNGLCYCTAGIIISLEP
jgi:hypothetical protein